MGVNTALDEELAPLRFADDDAARFQDLFRVLGAKTYLLTSPDENTARLHPQASAEAREPTRKNLEEVVSALSEDVAWAQKRGIPTVLYVVYAGHGNVKNGVGYVSLADAKLTGKQLAQEIISPVSADQAHLIVDACYSYFLAYGRGPGGTRRPVSGFSQVEEWLDDEKVGLLLSTSSARESHEWEAFQAGVFSHEIRSGLFGAADADGDGQVSYREIAAFVDKANAAIPNERFRPEVFARAPKATMQLLDLRDGLSRRIEIDGEQGAHYLLEDTLGVRLADFHNAPSQSVRLVRPGGAGRLYLRRVSDQQEFEISGAGDVTLLAALTPRPPRTNARGAAHDAFDTLFSQPFDLAAVETWSPRLPSVTALATPSEARLSVKRRVGLGLLAASVVSGAAGGYLGLNAQQQQRGVASDASQVEITALNQQLKRDGTAALLLGGAAVASAVAGAVLVWWSPEDPQVAVGVTGSSASLFYETRF